jgi:hypothetical protein
LKTTVDIYHYSSEVDLSDIGAMITQYCRKVRQLEEHIEELETENALLLRERVGEKV